MNSLPALPPPVEVLHPQATTLASPLLSLLTTLLPLSTPLQLLQGEGGVPDVHLHPVDSPLGPGMQKIQKFSLA